MHIDFSVGDAIEITREGVKYRTMVEKQIDEETFLIYTPIEKGHVLPIKQREILNVTFVVLEPENNKYDVYSFNAVVISREIVENVPMLKLQAQSQCKKIQRRDFYRLSIVKVILIEKVDEDSTIEIITKDVSAGGMMAISPQRLNINDEYLVYMNIFSESPIVLNAKVLSSERSLKEDDRYVNRFYFINIDKKVQSDMIRQINQLQVLEIRRRKHKLPSYNEALKTYLDEELLDRYNVDKNVDKRFRYLMFLNSLIILAMVVFFIMAGPTITWAPFFGEQVKSGWKLRFIKTDVFLSVILFLLSGLSIVYDRTHYHGRRQVNLFFVITLLFSLLSLLVLVIFMTSIV